MPTARLPRAYWVLWAGALVNKLGAFVVPFLAIHLTQVRGLSLATAGVIVSLYGAGSLASGPFGGVLADRIGRRKTILGATVLSAAAMLHLAFARAPMHIAVAAALLGFAGDMYRPALHAAVADVVAPAQRTRAYGLLYWVVNLGFAFSAVVGGLVAGSSFTFLFVADAATTLAFGALVFALVPETRPVSEAGAATRPSFLAPYRHTAFLAFVALTLAVAIMFNQFQVALPLDMTAHGIAPHEYGLLIAINGVLIVVVQPLAIRAVERAAPLRALALSAVLVGAGFGMTGIARSPAMYAASIAVWTLGEILMAPVTPAVVAALAPSELRGSYQGAMQIAYGGSTLLAPIVGTTILGAYGSSALWSACVAAGVSCAVAFLAMGRLQAFKRNAAPSPAAISSGVMRPSLSTSSASNTASVPDHSSRVM